MANVQTRSRYSLEARLPPTSFLQRRTTFNPYSARRLMWSPLSALSDHRFLVEAQRAQRPCQLFRYSPFNLPRALIFFTGLAQGHRNLAPFAH